MAIAEARIWQDLRALRAASVAHGVAAGDAVLAPKVVAHVHGARGPVPAGVLDALDARDRDVLAHMVASRTNRGIARLLFLSERAIERQITAIFAKLDVPVSPHGHQRVLAVLAYLRAAGG